MEKIDGICCKCGKKMKWAGKIFTSCEHCGQMQVWPTTIDSQIYIWLQEKQKEELKHI